jgi:hypothetical protein
MRQQKKRVFVGCEGKCEYTYGAFLSTYIDSVRDDRHLDRHNLGGGDPLALIEAAIGIIDREEEKYGAYLHKVIFMDSDLLGRSAERDKRFRSLVASKNIQIVWQKPCFEALILRHLPKCHTKQPTSTKVAMSSLQRDWKTYSKQILAQDLLDRVDFSTFPQIRSVEPDLDAFLKTIGIP